MITEPGAVIVVAAGVVQVPQRVTVQVSVEIEMLLHDAVLVIVHVSVEPGFVTVVSVPGLMMVVALPGRVTVVSEPDL